MQEVLMLQIFGWVVTAGCFLIGVGLLFFSKSLNQINQALNKSFYPLEYLEKLSKREISDRWIISGSTVLGILCLVLSVVFFAVLMLA